MVARKRFREDLYYRLNVFRIELPSLRERPADVPLLIGHILRRLSAAKAIAPPEISENAMQVLLNYPYPGNIRELENILEHALILCQENTLRRKHLPDYLRRPHVAGSDEACRPAEAGLSERSRLLAALQRCDWNRRLAAAALSMDRTTLWRKIKRYQLAP